MNSFTLCAVLPSVLLAVFAIARGKVDVMVYNSTARLYASVFTARRLPSIVMYLKNCSAEIANVVI